MNGNMNQPNYFDTGNQEDLEYHIRDVSRLSQNSRLYGILLYFYCRTEQLQFLKGDALTYYYVLSGIKPTDDVDRDLKLIRDRACEICEVIPTDDVNRDIAMLWVKYYENCANEHRPVTELEIDN